MNIVSSRYVAYLLSGALVAAALGIPSQLFAVTLQGNQNTVGNTNIEFPDDDDPPVNLANRRVGKNERGDPDRFYVGASLCRTLYRRNPKVVFTFQNFRFTGTVSAMTVYQVNGPAEGSSEGKCNEESKEGCTRIKDENRSDYDIKQLNEQPAGQVKVVIPFRKLVGVNDEITSVDDCAAQTPSGTAQQLGPPGGGARGANAVLFSEDVSDASDSTQTHDGTGTTDVSETVDATDTSATSDVSDAAQTVDATDTTDVRDTTDGGTQPKAGFNHDFAIRLFFEMQSRVGSRQTEIVDQALRIDLVRPNKPEIIATGASENSLQIRWRNPQNLVSGEYDSIYAVYSEEPLEGDVDEVMENAQTGRLIEVDDDDEGGTVEKDDVKIKKDPGTKLYVGVISVDYADNSSQISSIDGLTDVKRAVDFWEGYKSAGGAETGGGGCGCSSRSSAGPPLSSLLWVLVFGGLFVGRNRTDVF